MMLIEEGYIPRLAGEVTCIMDHLEHIPIGFEDMFSDSDAYDMLEIIEKLLHNTGSRYHPKVEKIFNAFHILPKEIDSSTGIYHPIIKVCIVGLDPYSGFYGNEEIAQGMSFSCHRDQRPVNPSLKNIYQRLEMTIPGFKRPEHGDLTGWAKQGVLLLNVALTVPYLNDLQRTKPNLKNPSAQHVKIWKAWTVYTLKYIGRIQPKCIYMIWGSAAKDLESEIPTTGLVLTSSHPSPLGYMHGFNTCNHFMEANQQLEAWGINPINWSDL